MVLTQFQRWMALSAAVLIAVTAACGPTGPTETSPSGLPPAPTSAPGDQTAGATLPPAQAAPTSTAIAASTPTTAPPTHLVAPIGSANPRLFFTDLESGPNTGEGSRAHGAWIVASTRNGVALAPKNGWIVIVEPL